MSVFGNHHYITSRIRHMGAEVEYLAGSVLVELSCSKRRKQMHVIDIHGKYSFSLLFSHDLVDIQISVHIQILIFQIQSPEHKVVQYNHQHRKNQQKRQQQNKEKGKDRTKHQQNLNDNVFPFRFLFD